MSSTPKNIWKKVEDSAASMHHEEAMGQGYTLKLITTSRRNSQKMTFIVYYFHIYARIGIENIITYILTK
jgi:hypothetical protein